MRSSVDRRLAVSAGIVLAVLLLTHLVTWTLQSFIEPIQAEGIDRLFRIRSHIASLAPRYDETIILVPIDDASLQSLGNFYLGRSEHARLVRNLGRAGVAAQFHDMIFAAPQDAAEDRELAEATADAGNVYYGMALGLSRGRNAPDPAPPSGPVGEVLENLRWEPEVRGDPNDLVKTNSYFVTFPLLAEPARGVGSVDIVPDNDGVYRRMPLVVRDRDKFLPTLALLVVCDYLGVEPSTIEVKPGRSVTLPGASRPGSDHAEDLVIPVDGQGRLIVNFVGPWGQIKSYPFDKIYEASDDRFMLMDLKEEIAGKIAVVSWIATGAGDIGAVPTDPLFPLVGVHANAMNTILTENFLRELSPLQMLLLVELPLLALLLLVGTRLSTIPFVSVAVILMVALFLLAGVIFLFGGWIIRLPTPLLAMLGTTLGLASYQFHVESKAKAVLRNTFDSYFSPSVVDKVMGDVHQLTSAAQKKNLTILFSDIKDFTRHTAEMDATHVRELLNEYFEKMIEIVFEQEGTLDKFIGDGLMVFFGDPQPQSDHTDRCVRTAIAMQLAARELNEQWRSRGDMPLEIRVGIHAGPVVVGNLGSNRRLSYTVLGESVNLAQRLESSAPTGGILISRQAWKQVRADVDSRELEPIRVKGFDRPIEVLEILVPDRKPPPAT